MKTAKCKCGNTVQGMARTKNGGTLLEVNYLCAACLRRWKTQEPNPNFKPVTSEQLRKYKNDE